MLDWLKTLVGRNSEVKLERSFRLMFDVELCSGVFDMADRGRSKPKLLLAISTDSSDEEIV